MASFQQNPNFQVKKDLLLKLLPELTCYQCHAVPMPGAVDTVYDWILMPSIKI
jgi:hypothetical protein